MSEFQPLPTDTPTPIAPPTPARSQQGFLARPIFLGLSIPWLLGSVLFIGAAAWYFFWPVSSTPDPGQLAFGTPNSFSSVQPAATPPIETGGLSVPTTTDAPAGSSVPEEVVKMIRDGRDYEAANREAITRLSNTVRAQTTTIANLQKTMDAQASQVTAITNRLTVLEARESTPAAHHVKGVRKQSNRSAISGMRIESIQDGMAWVSWQGRTWAVQAGDRLGPVTITDVNAANREVSTTYGTLR